MSRVAEMYWTDARLVKHALAGEMRAFERLVLRHQTRAQLVARAIGVRPGDVEDVIQESFVRAFEKLSQLRSSSHFRAWFLEIVRNAARHFLLSQSRESTATLESGFAVEVSESMADRVAQDELRRILWHHVSQLPESLRETLFLYYYEGRSAREVVRSLGVTRATVLKRLQRGREALRDRLWHELGEVVREMVPSAREARCQSRRLTLLVIGTSAAAANTVGATTKLGTSTAAGTLPSLGTKTLGGVIQVMAAKKMTVSLGVAALIVSSALFILNNLKQDPQEAPRIAALSDPSLPAATTAPRPQGDASHAEPKLVEASGDGAQEKLVPPSIQGTITVGESSGLPGVKVIALPVALWRRAIDETSRTLGKGRGGDPSPEIRALHHKLSELAGDFARTESEDQGGFHLHGLALGEYRLLASKEGFVPSVDTVVEVTGKGPAGCRIELLPSRALTGFVVDDAGKAIPGANVHLSPTSWRRAGGDGRTSLVLEDFAKGRFLAEGRQASTDALGRFQFSAIPLSTYDLAAAKKGYCVARVRDLANDENEVRVVLSKSHSLTVAVRSTGGRPIENAFVRMTATPDAPPAPGLGPPPQANVPDFLDLWEETRLEVQTDRLGLALFEDTKAGRFELAVFADGFASYAQMIVLDGEDSREEVSLEVARSITGVVFTQDQRPIRDARVWVELSRRQGRIWWGRPFTEFTTLSETRTGGDGRFTLEDLPGGSFTVRAAHRLYRASRIAGVSSGSEVALTLKEGERIRGVVLNADDDGAIVDAEIVFYADKLRVPEKRVFSDESGRFVIRGVDKTETDEMVLEVYHPDYGSVRREIAASELDTEIVLQLFPPKAVSGRVIGADGSAVAGAQIHMEIRGERLPFPQGKASIRSSAHGEFLAFVPSPKGTSYGGLELVATMPPGLLGRSETLVIRREEKVDVDMIIVLEETTALSGSVVDSAGEPVVGAVVVAQREHDPGGKVTGKPHSTLTRKDGTYRLRELETGSYRLEARSPRLAAQRVAGVELPQGGATVDFILEAGWRTEGTVVDNVGMPVPGAVVLALESKECDFEETHGNRSIRYQRRLYDSGLLSTATDAHGGFSIPHLADETWTLVARAPGFVPSDLIVVSTQNPRCELMLTPMGAIFGSVVDAETGRPVSSYRAMIQRTRDGGSGSHMLYREFSRPRGLFLIEGLSPASYSIAIVTEGYCRGGFHIDVRAGEEHEVRVEMMRGQILCGHVVDETTGEPIVGATVNLFDRRSGGWRDHWSKMATGHQQSGNDGRFHIAGVESGSYRLYVTRGGYVEEKLSLEVGDEAPAPLTLRLRPAGRLTGKLRNFDTSKRRVIWAWVLLETVDGKGKESRGSVKHGADEFKMEQVPPGLYRATLVEDVVKAERYEAFLKGETVSREDSFERRTPLGDVEIRQGETTYLESDLPKPQD